jgi:hypothetical protein
MMVVVAPYANQRPGGLVERVGRDILATNTT